MRRLDGVTLLNADNENILQLFASVVSSYLWEHKETEDNIIESTACSVLFCTNVTSYHDRNTAANANTIVYPLHYTVYGFPHDVVSSVYERTHNTMQNTYQYTLTQLTSHHCHHHPYHPQLHLDAECL